MQPAHNQYSWSINQLEGSIRYSEEGEFDLIFLLKILWRGKKIILGVTILSTLLAVCFALTLPNMYRPESLIISSASREGGFKSMLSGQLGGLATIAGVNLNSGSSDVNKSLAILRSRRFLEKFIQKHNVLVPLMATTWKPLSREFRIDQDLYDVSSARWVITAEDGRPLEPSAWKAVNRFRDLLSVSEDKASGLITISFEWFDPIQASHWVNMLVKELNKELRGNDRNEAQRAIAYLREQLAKTHLVDMQKVFYQLIESQMKTVMLTDARTDYAFQVIDPAVVPESRAKPNRIFICVLAIIIGGTVGISFVLISEYFFIPKCTRSG